MLRPGVSADWRGGSLWKLFHRSKRDYLRQRWLEPFYNTCATRRPTD